MCVSESDGSLKSTEACSLTLGFDVMAPNPTQNPRPVCGTYALMMLVSSFSTSASGSTVALLTLRSAPRLNISACDGYDFMASRAMSPAVPELRWYQTAETP